MTDAVDLQIQFRLAKRSDAMHSTHDVVATIDGAGSWRGESTIDYAQLGEAEQDPRRYGNLLGEALFNPSVMKALLQARGSREQLVRIRLLLETGPNGRRENHHGLRWERAFVALDDLDWPLAIRPGLPFSRYVPAESVDSEPSDDSVFRLLVAFASPDNLPADLHRVDIEADLPILLDGIDLLAQGRRFRLVIMPGRSGLSKELRTKLAKSDTRVIDGPSTIESIGRAVLDCHGLHLVAHGSLNAETQRGSLLLEDTSGHSARAFDDELYPWIHPNLRVAVLQSCQSAAPTPTEGPPFVGIGPRLVHLGVPAVVAMQDFVAMDDARVFAASFYRSLVRDGLVDVAVNEGRQAIFQKSRNDNFSIPALFMRLKSGLLWRPDPLRRAVVARLAELAKQPEHSLPTRAIQSLTKTLDYDSDTGPAGALFDMPVKLLELSEVDKALVVLVGPRGMAKGSQLQWVYRKAAQRFLDEDGTAPAPVSLSLRSILEARDVAAAVDRTVSALAGTQSGARPASPERPLVLLVDGDADLGGDSLREALRLLVEFRAGSAHRIVMTLDEGSRAAWNEDLEPTAVLVARPMDFGRVCQYLKRHPAPAADRVHQVIENRRCRDVAGSPWLLERMLALSQRNVTFDSRATLLQQIANQCLTSVSMADVPRSCGEQALERIAWQMQWGRRSVLDGAELFETLATVRGNREFRLADLKEALVRSEILATAGDDGVRFRYESLQAYYAARHLSAAPDRRRLIEDITASLGRLSRARWWENTLVTMAGLEGNSSEDLLQAILAGSPLVEGDQVYLASRCHLDTRKDGQAPEHIIDQIVDALIWRSHPGNLRPYADRKRAVGTLAELRHPNAIPHLVSLATDAIATGWGTEKRYEFSGIRLIAVNGLMLMQHEASDYVRDKRPALSTVLTAWWTAYEESKLDGLIAELNKADKATSPIAAFALGFFDDDRARQTLLEVFADDRTDRDVGWAIADTFTTLDPVWVSKSVIEPRLGQFVDPRVPYLIGRMGMAADGSPQRQYLDQCFVHGAPAVQARALRALGVLRADSIRPLCEAVVGGKWQEACRLGMSLPPELKEEDRNRLRNAAMESLREIGDDGSIEALRTARRQADMTITLRQLSFDVAEDIYWRQTGGLSGETFTVRKGQRRDTQ